MIVRERVYATTPERIWVAIATGPGLESWFCSSAEGKFEQGEFVTLDFNGCKGPLKIIEYRPYRRLSWRWHPGQIEGCQWSDFPESETTLVQFDLEPKPEGTLLRVTENGFENIPESRRVKVLELNGQGWSEVMEMIGKALEN